MNIQNEIAKLETVEQIEAAILLIEEQRMKICNNIVISNSVIYVDGVHAKNYQNRNFTINKQTVQVTRSPFGSSSENTLQLEVRTEKGEKGLRLTNDQLMISGKLTKYYKEDTVPKYLKQFYLELCELRKKIYGK